MLGIKPYTKSLTGDMSASFVTDWIPLDYYHSCFSISWTATGTPVGAWSVETSSDYTDTKTFTILDPDTFAPPWTNPTGSADATSIDFDTTKTYGRLRYTRSSGGTGATATIIFSSKDV